MKCHAPGVCAAIAGLLGVCAVAGAAPWRMVVVGDSRGADNGVNLAILTEIAAQIVTQAPDLVLFPGDLVTGSTNTTTLTSQLTNWRNIMQPVYDASIRVLAIRGNHENQGNVSAWNTVFAGAYAMPANGPTGEINITFSLAFDNALAVGLDEYTTHIHRVNQPWLDAQLAASSQPHVFVFGHEPAFKADHVDCLDDYPTNRDVFWASLAAAGARAYFCGHDHFYNHARIDDGDGNPDNDLHQYIVGSGGAPLVTFDGIYDGLNDDMVPTQLWYASAFGYLVVDIDGLNVYLTWMQRTSAGSYAVTEEWSYAAAPAPGDMNCDGYVNGQDIDGFLLVLFGAAPYDDYYNWGGIVNPPCDPYNADMNGDGAVNGQDIDGLVATLFAS